MFLCLEHARLIWIRSANSHTGPQLMLLHYEAGQMAASDLRAIIPKLPLAFVGASTEEHMAQTLPTTTLNPQWIPPIALTSLVRRCSVESRGDRLPRPH